MNNHVGKYTVRLRDHEEIYAVHSNPDKDAQGRKMYTLWAKARVVEKKLTKEDLLEKFRGYMEKDGAIFFRVYFTGFYIDFTLLGEGRWQAEQHNQRINRWETTPEDVISQIENILYTEEIDI